LETGFHIGSPCLKSITPAGTSDWSKPVSNGIYIVIGIYFLHGAPHLLALAYPEPKTPTTDTKK
jgi:hypothetical protein